MDEEALVLQFEGQPEYQRVGEKSSPWRRTTNQKFRTLTWSLCNPPVLKQCLALRLLANLLK